MIHLQRIGLINWHLMPAQDIEVRGDIGVIGENRSGKSTLLDLIQAVITGNNGRYLRLNASANESGRKKGSRSVHAYCLGRLGPDNVLRPRGALTFIFLVFRNETSPYQPTTIGLALEASATESSERTLAQFIANGVALSVGDFIEVATDGKEQPRDWTVTRPLLEERCRRDGGEFKVYRDDAGKYVADYMKLLSTGGRFVNKEQFLKSFVNAISFEQIPSATEFVRRYLLEERPFKIGQLRESIATYRNLQDDILRARDKLDLLKSMQAAIADFRNDLHTYEVNRWIAARAEMDQSFQEHRRLRRLRDQGLASQIEAKREIQEYDGLRDELGHELGKVIEAIHSKGLGLASSLTAEQKAADSERRETLRSLEEFHRAVSQGIHLLAHRSLLPRSAMPQLDLLSRLKIAAGSAALPTWPGNPQDVAGVLDNSDFNLAPLTEYSRHGSETAIKEQGPLEANLETVRKQIKDIQDKGITLSPNTEALASELETKGWKPRIVCTLLQITDDEWRNAAEALLGRDREAILVADAHVEDAISHLQRNRGRFRGCRIVNTRKLDARDTKTQSGTLASIVTSSDPLALAFVIRRIGNVRLAHSIEELHRPGRAIMQDGTYDDGLIVEMRNAEGYKIGAGAGRLGLTSLNQRFGELNNNLQEAKSRAEIFKMLEAGFTILIGTAGRGSELIALCNKYQRLAEQLDRISVDIKALEHNIPPDMKARREALESQIKIYEDEARKAIGQEKEAKQIIANATEALASSEQGLGSRWNLKLLRQRYSDVRSHLHRSVSRPAYAEALTSHKNDIGKVADTARKITAIAKERIDRGQSVIFDSYIDFHSQFGLKSELIRDKAGIIADVEPWVCQGIERIEKVDLVRWSEEAAAAAEKTRNIFQHSFAFELRERFDGLKKTLEDMNSTLRGHDFHYERYRFTSQPVELYRDVVTLVEASREDDAVFSFLFDAGVDSGHPHAQALKTVQDLLLDESRDIVEFEDYRKYFTFNLIMKDVKTSREIDLEARRGTGSGAEQQVPFYIAIGTALAAAYHGRHTKDDNSQKGIGLAVFDEAFSKLDGRNQKACMDYYEKLGLQVVVAAPFEKRATLYETMESFVETIRTDDHIEIEFYEVRDRTRRAFSEANPAKVNLDEFRRFVAEGKVTQ